MQFQSSQPTPLSKREIAATAERAARESAARAARHRLSPDELLRLVAACGPFEGNTPTERLTSALAVYRNALDNDLHGGRAEEAAFEAVVQAGGMYPDDLRRFRGRR